MNLNIINLTQHKASNEQIASGVVDAPEAWGLPAMLTFDNLESCSSDSLTQRARGIAILAATTGHTQAMVGGASFFMVPLCAALRAVGIMPVCAFSVRESVEEVQMDGSVRKVAVFRHLGFVPADAGATTPVPTPAPVPVVPRKWGRKASGQRMTCHVCGELVVKNGRRPGGGQKVLCPNGHSATV